MLTFFVGFLIGSFITRVSYWYKFEHLMVKRIKAAGIKVVEGDKMFVVKNNPT